MIRTSAALNHKHFLLVGLGDFHVRAETHVIRLNISVGRGLADLLGCGRASVHSRRRGPGIHDGGTDHLRRGSIGRDAEIGIIVNDCDQRKRRPVVHRGRGLDIVHGGGLGVVTRKTQHGGVHPVRVGSFSHERVLRILAYAQLKTPSGVSFGSVECVTSVGSAALGLVRAEADALVVHEVACHFGAIRDGGDGGR